MLGRIHARLRQTQQVYMVLVSVVIGLLGGLWAVAFRECIRLGQVLAWHTHEYSLDYIRALPAWWKVAAPAGGGLIVGCIIYFFAAEAKGHGVPEVMESVVLRGGRIRPRVVLAKMVASGVCIASGGSAGREGPIVQIGAAVGSTVGQWLGIGERRLRTLVGCGAAAGIAGTFNAPVAGALFAVEIILGDFGVAQFSPIVISSVAATVVSRHFLGDFPAFEVPRYTLISPFELLAYAGLGVLAGLAALLFIRMLYGAEDFFDRLRIPGPIKPVIGGALVGVIALRFPEVFGVGYEAINEALRNKLVLPVLLVLVVAKIVAVSLTIGSGGSGGIFAPSLFIGAMLGGAVGTGIHTVWPNTTGGPGAYALVGMGAVVGAATHAPITAILIIFELTNDYKIILPLMITCISATLLATQLQRASIYTLKLLRRGVEIQRGQTVNILRHLTAGDVMRESFNAVAPADSVMVVVSRFIAEPGGALFVVDGEERLLGVVTMDEIRPIMADLAALGSVIIAADMMRLEGFPVFAPDDPLDDVMRRFHGFQYNCPVVEEGRVAGAVWPQDVIERYNSEVFKREMASSMSLALTNGAPRQGLPGVQGVSLAEVPVPGSFIGRTLGEIDIRRRFNVTVLLIKRHEGDGEELVDHLPDAVSGLEAGDVLLVIGADAGIQHLERQM